MAWNDQTEIGGGCIDIDMVIIYTLRFKSFFCLPLLREYASGSDAFNYYIAGGGKGISL